MLNQKMNVCLAMLATLGLIVLTSGCGGNKADGMFANATNSNAKRLAVMYFQYQIQNTENRLLGPSSEEDLRGFIQKQNQSGLDRVGIDKENLEELWGQ